MLATQISFELGLIGREKSFEMQKDIFQNIVAKELTQQRFCDIAQTRKTCYQESSSFHIVRNALHKESRTAL